MQAFLRCDDPRLVSWLLSNPVPPHDSKGAVTILCGGQNYAWPIPRDEQPKKDPA